MKTRVKKTGVSLLLGTILFVGAGLFLTGGAQQSSAATFDQTEFNRLISGLYTCKVDMGSGALYDIEVAVNASPSGDLFLVFAASSSETSASGKTIIGRLWGYGSAAPSQTNFAGTNSYEKPFNLAIGYSLNSDGIPIDVTLNGTWGYKYPTGIIPQGGTSEEGTAKLDCTGDFY